MVLTQTTDEVFLDRRLLIALLLTSFLAGCGGSLTSTQAGPPTHVAQLAWNANREAAVNREGGGYRIAYAKTAGFADADATTVDVPYSKGSTPTKATISGLDAGTYFFRITAYSALKAPGGASSTSAASPEVTLTVP